MNKNNAMLFQTMFGDYPTFSMMPLDDTTPFSEVIWDRELGRLAVISKYKRQTFQMMVVLDGNGNPKKAPGRNEAMKERKLMELAVEYYLVIPDEIEFFISQFAANVDTFDYKKYMTPLKGVEAVPSDEAAKS